MRLISFPFLDISDDTGIEKSQDEIEGKYHFRKLEGMVTNQI